MWFCDSGLGISRNCQTDSCLMPANESLDVDKASFLIWNFKFFVPSRWSTVPVWGAMRFRFDVNKGGCYWNWSRSGLKLLFRFGAMVGEGNLFRGDRCARGIWWWACRARCSFECSLSKLGFVKVASWSSVGCICCWKKDWSGFSKNYFFCASRGSLLTRHRLIVLITSCKMVEVGRWTEDADNVVID